MSDLVLDSQIQEPGNETRLVKCFILKVIAAGLCWFRFRHKSVHNLYTLCILPLYIADAYIRILCQYIFLTFFVSTAHCVIFTPLHYRCDCLF